MNLFIQEKDGLSLWAMLINGNEEAFTEIRRQYYDELHMHAYKTLKNYQDADDVMQEVFIRLWARHTILPLQADMDSYLYKMTYNACMDHFRDQKKNRIEYRQESQLPEQVIQNDPVESKEAKGLIDAAIAGLPTAQRMAVLLHTKGLSYKEIAAQTGTSANTIGNQLVTAREALRKKLLILRKD